MRAIQVRNRFCVIASTVNTIPDQVAETRRLIGTLPSKFLLSSQLLNRPVSQEEFSKSTGMDSLVLANKTDLQPRVKTRDYQLAPSQYAQFFSSNPHGRVHIFDYRGVNFTVAGSHLHQLPNKNIYKLLLYSRPDLIILQIRPDAILKGFQLSPARSKTPDQFSSSLYFEQLCRSPSEVMPNDELRRQVRREIRESNILVNETQTDIEHFTPYQLYERTPLDKVATACYYGENHGNIPIVLGDLPETVFRSTITNPLTLAQLQSMFEQCAKNSVLNPDLYPNTPLSSAFLMFPGVFLRRSDEYMSTILEYVSALKKFKRVFVLTGHGSADAISNLLDWRKSSHFSMELAIPGIKGSLLKDLTCEDLLERHTVLDVMHYGLDIFQNFEHKQIRSIYCFYLPILQGVAGNDPAVR